MWEGERMSGRIEIWKGRVVGWGEDGVKITYLINPEGPDNPFSLTIQSI